MGGPPSRRAVDGWVQPGLGWWPASIDREALRSVGPGGGPAADLPADAFARAPSTPGYRPTLPSDSPAAGRDLDEAARLLTEAGYERGDDGTWARDGRPLVLRLAAPAQVAPFGRLVAPLGTQLRAAGIASVVVADSGTSDFLPGRGPASTTTTGPPPTTAGSAPTPRPTGPAATTIPAPASAPAGASSTTTTTTVPPTPDSPSDLAVADIAVLALPVGTDPVTDLASVIGCPGGRAPATSGRTADDPAVDLAADAAPAVPGATSAAPSTPAAPTSTSAPTSEAPAATATGAPPSSTAAPAPGDPADAQDPVDAAEDDAEYLEELTEPQASEALTATGFCDPALQSLLDAASAGAVSADTAIALAEPVLWSALPTVPLFQAASVLVGPADRTDVVVGPLTASPFAGADRWVPPPATQRGDDGIN